MDSTCHNCLQQLTPTYIDTGSHRYHQNCFQCFECKCVLTNTYVALGDKVFCESHAYNANPVFCGDCGNVIKGAAMSVNDVHFHSECLRCFHCKNQITAIVIISGRFFCLQCSEVVAAAGRITEEQTQQQQQQIPLNPTQEALKALASIDFSSSISMDSIPTIRELSALSSNHIIERINTVSHEVQYQMDKDQVILVANALQHIKNEVHSLSKSLSFRHFLPSPTSRAANILRAPADAFGRLVFMLIELCAFLIETFQCIREQITSSSNPTDILTTARTLQQLLQYL